LKPYQVTFSDDYNEIEKDLVIKHIDFEMPKLLKIHPEKEIKIEFLSIYVESKYLYFSAASDEPRKMWFKLNRFNNFSDVIKKQLKSTLAHEFHHMIRWTYNDKFNLAELLINEGLATLFSMKFCKKDCPLNIKKLSNHKIKYLIPLIKRDLLNEKFDHRIWQKGDEKIGIPASFAYSFGYKLVKDFYE